MILDDGHHFLLTKAIELIVDCLQGDKGPKAQSVYLLYDEAGI